jgi:hypothetical protein
MEWKRNQVVWSLWNLAVGLRQDRPWQMGEIPKAFTRKVYNLIEFGVGMTHDRRTGSGTDQLYITTDAVELAIGLDLMTLAWPQSEVAEFIDNNRAVIRNRVEQVNTSAKDRVLMWILPEPAGIPKLRGGDNFTPSLIYYEPQFTSNENEEKHQLGMIGVSMRDRVIIDVGSIKRNLAENLAVAPVVRRGRQ